MSIYCQKSLFEMNEKASKMGHQNIIIWVNWLKWKKREYDKNCMKYFANNFIHWEINFYKLQYITRTFTSKQKHSGKNKFFRALEKVQTRIADRVKLFIVFCLCFLSILGVFEKYGCTFDYSSKFLIFKFFFFNFRIFRRKIYTGWITKLVSTKINSAKSPRDIEPAKINSALINFLQVFLNSNKY